MQQKQILIIGGGMAGLTAAAELSDFNVTLLEAKEQWGGRIQTLHGGNTVVELGAAFVHGQSKPLIDAIHDARLTMKEVSMRNRVLEEGELRPMEVWDEFSELAARIDTQKPDQSFISFLNKQSMNESDRQMMIAYVEGFNAAHATRISVHSLRRAEYSAEQMEGDTQMRLDRGYADLVKFMLAKARAAGVTLINRTVVKKVRWQRGHVEIEALRDGKASAFSGDAAIVTLPLGVLKARAVSFEPSLVDKEEAIAGMEFGNVVKVTLVFHKQWWPDGDFGFIHALDEALPTWWSDPRGPVLTGWAGGPRADALLGKSEQDLKQIAIEILARIFATATGTVVKHLTAVHAYDWAADPYILGSYSYIPLGGMFFPKQLAAPVDDTLFFAGEATARDGQMGTVFAAMESGERAAHELNQCLAAAMIG